MSRNATALPARTPDLVHARITLFAALDQWAEHYSQQAERRVRNALAEINRLEHQPSKSEE